jgi:hypothetical protein
MTEVHLAEEGVTGAGRRDPQGEGLLAREGPRRERRVQGAVTVGVELVDDVRARVKAVLERGVRRQGAHEAAVAGALDEVRLDA